jgi:outer membrane receptor for ferrienterochelin and colicin
MPLTELAKLTVTLGADESRSTRKTFSGSYIQFGDSYGNRFGMTQSHASEHGGFLNSVLGVWDAIFLTYGLRAVYNPNLGANQNPNFEPRYGIAMTQAFGGITAKVRASYGTSTRPPSLGQKDPSRDPYYAPFYGTDVVTLGNPDLVPESQQGGEGGLELYFGNRASLNVTHYNETVDHLIVAPVVDSVDQLPQFLGQFGCNRLWQCPLHQTEYLNIGSIRNQGWTAVGTLNLGALTAQGTYSLTKSRIIGITPRYRNQFPEYVVGAAFQLLAEHTWATDFTYAIAKTSIALNVQGQGRSIGNESRTLLNLAQDRRLFTSESPLAWGYPVPYLEVTPGFALGNLNVSQQLTTHIEGLLQIYNVANSFRGDFSPALAQPGRSTGLGVRIRW